MLILNEQNFEQEVIQNNKPVLVDFYTTWCSPCRKLAPVLDKLAEELVGKVVVAKVDVGETMSVAQKYNIGAVPTLIIFKNGEEIKRFVGAEKMEVLKAHLNALVSE